MPVQRSVVQLSYQFLFLVELVVRHVEAQMFGLRVGRGRGDVGLGGLSFGRLLLIGSEAFTIILLRSTVRPGIGTSAEGRSRMPLRRLLHI